MTQRHSELERLWHLSAAPPWLSTLPPELGLIGAGAIDPAGRTLPSGNAGSEPRPSLGPALATTALTKATGSSTLPTALGLHRSPWSAWPPVAPPAPIAASALTDERLKAQAPPASSTATWVQLPGSGTTATPRLWQWTVAGAGASMQNDTDTLVITHGWLGSGVTSVPSDPSGFNPAFTALAKAAAAAGRQVLFLDWGTQAMDPNPSGLAPYNAAGRIQSVAYWAKGQLQTLAASGRRLSFSGHSLGSYLGAQTALLLGSGANLRVQALDPAASGLNGSYDINSANSAPDPLPSLGSTATAGSLAFVVADTNFSIGIAGDNARAATAARSFVVSGFASGTSATVAHGAIPALAADLARYLPLDSDQSEALLGSFLANRFSDSGGSSGTLRHEGVVRLRNNSGAIDRISGISPGGINQTVQFVDAGDNSTPNGSSGVRDVIVSLRSLQLSATASIEEVILGGNTDLSALGSNQGERLIGNQAANELNGNGGNDTVNGGGGSDRITGGIGADNLIGGLGTVQDTFLFSPGHSGQTTNTDFITDFQKGTPNVGDVIDYSGNLTVGGSTGTASSNQASINQSTGVATFAARSGTNLSDALADITTRFTAATNTAGEFAFFKVNNTGNFYIFISDDTPGVTANDLVVQLNGVTSIASISLNSGNLTILS